MKPCPVGAGAVKEVQLLLEMPPKAERVEGIPWLLPSSHLPGPPSGRKQQRAGVRTPPITDENRETRRNLRALWTWVLHLLTSRTLPLGLGFCQGSTNLFFPNPRTPFLFLFLFALLLALLPSSSLPWLLYVYFFSLTSLSLALIFLLVFPYTSSWPLFSPLSPVPPLLVLLLPGQEGSLLQHEGDEQVPMQVTEFGTITLLPL